MSMRWPCDRGDQVADRSCSVRPIGLEHDATGGLQRREVFEVARVRDPLGVLAVDGSPKQREVALGFLGGGLACTTLPLRPNLRIWLGLIVMS